MPSGLAEGRKSSAAVGARTYRLRPVTRFAALFGSVVSEHFPSITYIMIAPETSDHIENLTKRAGHLWRFL
ncbi:MAG: hypothetical protein RIQ93_1601 [Verrucomicrobiota bacterium]